LFLSAKKALIESDIWKKHTSVQTWLMTNWLAVSDRWAIGHFGIRSIIW
jgi:hypothetical protein